MTNTLAFANDVENCLNFHVIKNSPMGYYNANGDLTGVHLEYLNAIEKQSGLCINKTLTPYPRIWESIKHGKHDGGIIFRSNSRDDFVKYVGKIKTVKTVVLPVKGAILRSYDDLKNLRIGKTKGTHLSERFDGDDSLNIIELTGYDQAAKMIRVGRIDAVAGSALVLSYQLNKHNVIDKIALENKLTLGEKEQWLQLAKTSRHQDKLLLMQKAIKELQAKGALTEILDKYYGSEWQSINN